ncbi:hypothetical protein [Actibacterium ureilyticum]|uniref:hypothetical protein n=1 Tax=Actibacterium ureilyticum TaxID=1590614 RepID=UPI000BAAE741|nr:hypothetical protein [Actibacterium ureilyticum]
MQLIQSAIADGRWQGLIATDRHDPVVEIWHQGMRLDGVAVEQQPGTDGQVLVSFAIPAELLSDGVQTFIVRDGDGTQIGHFSILTGTPLDQDLRAEIDLLRAELDLLKKAFRRHCADG